MKAKVRSQSRWETRAAKILRRSARRWKDGPIATAVRYDPPTDTILVTLKNAGVVGFRRSAHELLAKSAPSDVAKVEACGLWISWPALDDGVDIEWVIEKALGRARTRVAAAQLGKKTSPAKAAASRKNGRKGGRPPKKAA